LAAFPFLEDLARPRPLLLVVPLAAVFVAGVLVADAGRRSARAAVILAAIPVALGGLSLLNGGSGASDWIAAALALMATAGLILFSTYCLLGYVLRARTITRDQIYAGVCMYIMLGFAFGTLFYLISMLDPRSFAANEELLARGDRPDLMYFSFVTLATLGYGDITPRTNIARSLAIVEALAGMLYIAIFMARLVSMRSDAGEREGG
jgi:hypothetical protein